MNIRTIAVQSLIAMASLGYTRGEQKIGNKENQGSGNILNVTKPAVTNTDTSIDCKHLYLSINHPPDNLFRNLPSQGFYSSQSPKEKINDSNCKKLNDHNYCKEACKHPSNYLISSEANSNMVHGNKHFLNYLVSTCNKSEDLKNKLIKDFNQWASGLSYEHGDPSVHECVPEKTNESKHAPKTTTNQKNSTTETVIRTSSKHDTKTKSHSSASLWPTILLAVSPIGACVWKLEKKYNNRPARDFRPLQNLDLITPTAGIGNANLGDNSDRV